MNKSIGHKQQNHGHILHSKECCGSCSTTRSLCDRQKTIIPNENFKRYLGQATHAERAQLCNCLLYTSPSPRDRG